MAQACVLTCRPDGGAFKYFMDGVENAFRLLSIPTLGVSEFNSLFEPKLYLGCSEGWRFPVAQEYRCRFGTKLLFHVNPIGPEHVPGIDESEGNKQITLAEKPDGVYCYAGAGAAKKFYGDWETVHGCKVWPMPLAADTTVYYNGDRALPLFQCDVAWVGGVWAYKKKMTDVYLEPLREKYNCQFYGWSNNWGRGPIADADCRHLFASAKICPCISEPHSVEYPVDLPERVYKVISSGGFAIHTPTEALDDLHLDDVIPIAKDAGHWFDLFDCYVHDEVGRTQLRLAQYEAVMGGHTYLHRIAPWVREFFPEKVELLEGQLAELCKS